MICFLHYCPKSFDLIRLLFLGGAHRGYAQQVQCGTREGAALPARTKLHPCKLAHDIIRAAPATVTDGH